MSTSQNVIDYAKKVHFQGANVNLFPSEKSQVVQIELEKVDHIPYGTIHLSEAGLQNQLSSDVDEPVGPQKTSNIFNALGLSSKDLDEVGNYPKDKLTLDSLPKILKQIKKKRASMKYCSPQQSLSNRTLCEDGIGEMKSTEKNFESQEMMRKPLVNYGYDLSSGDSSAGSEYEGKCGEAFHKKERHFSESPHHSNKFDSDSETESDEEVIDSPCAEEQSVLEKKRKTPILQNVKDFLGCLPMVLPHCCSLCDKAIDTLQDWNEHMNEPLHKLRCLLLQRVYPDWVPGELPATRENLVEKGTVTTVVTTKKGENEKKCRYSYAKQTRTPERHTQ